MSPQYSFSCLLVESKVVEMFLSNILQVLGCLNTAVMVMIVLLMMGASYVCWAYVSGFFPYNSDGLSGSVILGDQFSIFLILLLESLPATRPSEESSS